MSSIEKEIDQAKRTGQRRLKKQLERRYGINIVHELHRAHFSRRHWIYVEARNNHVKQSLRAAYQERIKTRNLDVFCISNTTYQEHSEKGNVDMVEKSGVPELRRFCRKITARAQLLQALHFIRSEVPGLLNSIKIWTENFQQVPEGRSKDDDNGVLEAYENAKESVSISQHPYNCSRSSSQLCQAHDIIVETHFAIRTKFNEKILSLFSKSGLYVGSCANVAKSEKGPRLGKGS